MPSKYAKETAIRLDIQGLRAIAVLTVVIYHIWPHALPGGFIGVDVFFVISGYLITSNLLREVERTGTIDFRAFYIRRALRLLPASALVIGASLLLVPLLTPSYTWVNWASQAAASLFYFQNWLLFREAVDYLSADNLPTAFQHFWSLAIEEQFYLLWPAVMMLPLVSSALRRLSYKKALIVVCFVIAGTSFTLSVVLSGAQTPENYFATHVRLWELALGGLVAVAGPTFLANIGKLGFLGGLFLIAASAFALSGEIAFPGYVALLPTIGATLIIVSGRSNIGTMAILLSNRPFVFLGGISYSLYLVHWPLVVFFKPEARGFAVLEGALLAAVAVLLSWSLKRWVEDRFRTSGHVTVYNLRPIATASALCLVPVLTLGFVAASSRSEAFDPARHPGALVLLDNSRKATDTNGEFFPPLKTVKRDRATLYDNGCHLRFEEATPQDCRFGNANGQMKVFLIGDSHAANWYPALELLAEEQNWNGFAFTKSSCPLVPVMLNRSGAAYTQCLEWAQRVLERIEREKPDLVIFGQESRLHAFAPEDDRQLPKILADLWRAIRPHVGAIIAMVDTAKWPNDPNECVAKDSECELPLSQLLSRDPFVEAASLTSDAKLVDMNEYVCPQGLCAPLTGNVLVWRDRHHLTATYSRSLKTLLLRKLERAMNLGPGA